MKKDNYQKNIDLLTLLSWFWECFWWPLEEILRSLLDALLLDTLESRISPGTMFLEEDSWLWLTDAIGIF